MEKLPLKAFRAANNLTQKQVAEQIGVNRMTYNKWENYETYPDAMQLIALSELFKCPIDAFYFPKRASLKLAKNTRVDKIDVV